ncbi:MAG: bifunctional 5,10-methylenetetrahydrofolate dehydrogenase/5,10-methenyltetrahydrofolate cyclohydrolase [Phycisphaerae bacterium]|jgi:methylenetetrahydrofolate dehydrogenase (NADP+) / methenyltetrahydrofolate cyclohydrolase|nr:bifunctional 5,10-methylenetetrahydrofolate dehydrogenase/5,10-methenyltetrahydrofolate cyclohydrolase [Phycisphaerae bacterium]MBT6269115.1 bifunctional 5,10-methylenetetrahydrofolate dehydrogenase/5,10-methenyltetrahydrofolate cyclohydrolase [Phycisphaerae bacterium]MBT6282654.1 bifunctional 5,10-methylenetetrahydrofolate dehydrogenase/5,10-methenyltetrahydrofolate cyclohydrolase [Phycisphaerae bacterium]
MAEATIIDGRALAATVKDALTERVHQLQAKGIKVRLDAVLVGGDQGAHLYAKNQAKACSAVGIEYMLHELSETATQDEIANTILELNENKNVTAIMAHMPLPSPVDASAIQMLIAVAKDVEGVNPANIGNIVFGRRSLVPCTALAVMEMIESTGVEIRGSRAVCVGASTIVGKPVAVLLMQAEATVISTNIHTKNCDDLMRSADILVSAAGVPNLITADVVKDGAVVIDVGINRIVGDDGNKRTVGDVDFSAVKNMAGYISPVPGGVGPMTVAMLLRNTVQAAETTS